MRSHSEIKIWNKAYEERKEEVTSFLSQNKDQYFQGMVVMWDCIT